MGRPCDGATLRQCAYDSASGLVAARVSPGGEVRDDPSIVVSASGDGAGLEYALASDGSGGTVIWQGRSAGNTDIRGCRIGPEGTVPYPAGVVIVPRASFVHSGFSVACSKDRYLIDAGGFPVDASSSPSGKAAPAIAGCALGGAHLAWHAFSNNA